MEVVNTLDHPNVLSLLGVTMDNQQFVMVSEWMANGNINQFVEAHPDANRFELVGLALIFDNTLHYLSPPIAQRCRQGLIYMHDQEMVHGDLKGVSVLQIPVTILPPDGRAPSSRTIF